MNRIQQLLRTADRTQQGRRWLAIPVATWKKFGDDQAGNLAALISYYAFASIFPLLLVFVTILDLALANNPAERAKLENSALSQYPVVGNDLLKHVHGLSGTGLCAGHRPDPGPAGRAGRGQRGPERAELGLGGAADAAARLPVESGCAAWPWSWSSGPASWPPSCCPAWRAAPAT